MSFHTCIKAWGNNLLYVGYDDYGKRIQKSIEFKPRLWTLAQSPTGYTDIRDNHIQELDFDTIREAKEFIKTYEGVENFKVFGTNRFEQLFIAEQYKNDIDYDFNTIRTFFLDIENDVDSTGNFTEPHEANAPITLITIRDSKTKKFIVFANTENSETRFINTIGDTVDYREFDNEFSMLQDFLNYWSSNYPDIVTGWNTRGYDIVYIITRMNMILGEKKTRQLSPWGIIQSKKSNISRFGKTEDRPSYEIYGINELDYMDLYMKYNMGNSESFALDFIAEKELGESKVTYEGTLSELYRNDFQKYVEYNIKDVALVVKLDEKKQFLKLIVEMSYFGKVSMFNDSLGTVRFWEHLIFNHLYKQNRLPEIKSLDVNTESEYVGGYVKEPQTGLHEWVASIDATSLYPSLIRQINIGIDTHIPKDQITDARAFKYRHLGPENYKSTNKIDNTFLIDNNYGLACNGEVYDNTRQSFLSELMEKLFKNRKEYKNTMLDYKKEVSKIEEEIAKRR